MRNYQIIKISYTIHTIMLKYFTHMNAQNAGRTKHFNEPFTTKTMFSKGFHSF